MSQLDKYRRASPAKNLAFLEVQVQARLNDTTRFQGIISLLTEGFSQMPTRLAALALAFFMGTEFGLMPGDSAVAQSEFSIFSGDAP